LQRMRRFSRYWDLLANSGNFVATTPLVWVDESPFEWFLKLSNWLYDTTGQTHAISLTNLSELLFKFLTQQRHLEAQQVAEAIWKDFQRVGRSDRPKFLQPYVERADTRTMKLLGRSRQSRHNSIN